jgi:MFS family permease
VLTLVLQLGEHYSAIHAGLTLAPFALGTAVGATLAAAVLVPRFGRAVLQGAAVIVAIGTYWLYHVVNAHGLATTSLDLVAPQLVAGIGLGMLISPLFDFILASVTDSETGSASGVLNAMQQLAGAIGVAAIGTLFFSTLAHSGYVTAMSRCLLVELATTPVLFALTRTLPARPREDIDPVTESAGDAAPATPAAPVLVSAAALAAEG